MKTQATYIPFRLELIQAYKRPRNALIGKDRLVLFKRPLADLSIVCLWDGILEESLL